MASHGVLHVSRSASRAVLEPRDFDLLNSRHELQRSVPHQRQCWNSCLPMTSASNYLAQLASPQAFRSQGLNRSWRPFKPSAIVAAAPLAPSWNDGICTQEASTLSDCLVSLCDCLVSLLITSSCCFRVAASRRLQTNVAPRLGGELGKQFTISPLCRWFYKCRACSAQNTHFLASKFVAPLSH